MGTVQSLVAFLGRAMLSIIFISSAVHKFVSWQGTLLYFNQALTDWVATSAGTPWIQNSLEWALAHASTLLLVGVLFELVGGLCVFLGLWTRLGALLLALFLALATVTFHRFWELQEPERQVQMINCMKNVSIMGGLLFLLAVGKGGKSSKAHE